MVKFTGLKNPIINLKKWHSERTATDPMQKLAPSYKKAVDTFQMDLASLQSCDHDPASGPVTSKTQDQDPRPGEVEIPNHGSLHSTKDGFEVKKQEAGSVSRSLNGKKIGRDKERSYQINESTGTIAVFNTIGDKVSITKERDEKVKDVKPGYQESYTINTLTNEVSDYKRSYTSAPLAIVN